MRGNTQNQAAEPAPPSREAEIAAERLAENETMLADGYDIPTLLTQLQQARQELEEAYAKGVSVGRAVEAKRAEAALQQAREALRDYGRHNEGCSAESGTAYRCRCGWLKIEAALKDEGR